MTNQIEAFTQDPQATETLWCLGELQHVLAGGERTGEAFSVVIHEAAEGHAPPWHRQPGDDETFYVLDGEIDFWVEDPVSRRSELPRGPLVFIPRGTPHAFRIASASARWLTFHTPAGHERSTGPAANRRTNPRSHQPASRTWRECSQLPASTASSCSGRRPARNTADDTPRHDASPSFLRWTRAPSSRILLTP